MTRRWGGIVTLAVAVLLATAAAGAAEWTVDAEASRIGFRATQMGAGFEGRFHRFTGEVRFDPDDPEAGRAAFTVEIASVDTGNAERDQAILTADWMDAASHPAATFETDSITRENGGRYRAEGRLTMRGTSRAVMFPFTFSPQGGTNIAEVAGEIAVSRTDFGIGRGEFAADGVIGDRVVIQIRLIATRD